MEWQRLIEQWHSVDVEQYEATAQPKMWSEDGLRCLETNRDCAHCPLYKTYGIFWNGTDRRRCLQPVAVQKLINRQLPIPGDASRTPRTGWHWGK